MSEGLHTYEICHETPKAFLVFTFGSHKAWIPKSQITIISIDKNLIDLLLPEWLYDKTEEVLYAIPSKKRR